MLRDLDISGGRVIPQTALEMRFSRSGGPGGQHVNRTETKVDLRLDLAILDGMWHETTVARIRERLRNRLDGDGKLQVVCSETRSRQRNAEIALDRMEELLRVAAKPVRVRRKTRPTRGSQERRLDDKKRRSDIKRQRRGDD